jgi:hypothetical protein
MLSMGTVDGKIWGHGPDCSPHRALVNAKVSGNVLLGTPRKAAHRVDVVGDVPADYSVGEAEVLIE